MEITSANSKHNRIHHWIIGGLFMSLAVSIGFVALQSYKQFMILDSQINDLTNLNNALSIQNKALATNLHNLESSLAFATSKLEKDITTAELTLSEKLQQEQQNVSNIKEQLGDFQNEVGEIAGSVNTLEKLSKTDPELLQKYSKVFFLNEHYVPPKLTFVPDAYTYSTTDDPQVHGDVWPHLESLLENSNRAGIELYILSAYRSFEEQGYLKGKYSIIYGAGTANQFSADQGYSEHQLGTTIDFMTTGIGGSLLGFEKTPAYAWLQNNAHKYGFALSYPENNAYYIFEPWHWRYVGTSLARELRNTNKSFYDLDQRKIDTYLVSIFD